MTRHFATPPVLLLFAGLALSPLPAAGQDHGNSYLVASGWTLGPMVGTYTGPSHANVLAHVNNLMAVMGSDPANRFEDFEVGTPFGVILGYEPKAPITFALTYYYSSYSSEAKFNIFGWESPRELTTHLHDMVLSLRYSLGFVKSNTIVPYIGGGIGLSLADSRLNIDLNNVNNVPFSPSVPDSVRPDESFAITSRAASLGGVALAGVAYNLSSRLHFIAEMQGILGQIRQNFDYDGSLKYLNPSANQDQLENPGLNDLLFGSYQLDLNGLRLTLGLVYGL